MLIETIEITKINPAAYNPRKDLQPEDAEYQKLKKGIDEFDLVEPLVWNKQTGNLVGGHQRLKILNDRGDTTVQVSVVDLDDAHEKALNLALNKISGEWDTDKLSGLLGELQALPDFDIELTGFDVDEVTSLNPAEVVEDNFDVDDALADIDEPVTKLGDIILLGKHRLMCGDSTNKDDINLLTDSVTIGMVLTDPPYCSGGFQESGKKSGSVGTRGDIMVANDTLSTRGYQSLIKNVLSNIQCGVVYIFTDWRMWVNLFDVVESSGFGIRNMIVWDKGSPGMGAGWRMQHELIMCGIKSKHPFDPHKAQGNVITCKRTGNINHPTEKPIELLAKVIKVNDLISTIYDPFIGSGSTLIAAEQTNRICYGMELDPKYCDVIVKRWEEFTGQEVTRP